MVQGFAVKVSPEVQSKHLKKKKLRVVFEFGATYQGICLKLQLLQGPDPINSLMGILTRLRQKPVAFMADIEAMFHQVKVPEEDSVC